MKFTGAGSAFDLLIGGSPVENLSIHATLMGTGTQNPVIEDTGVTLNNVTNTTEVRVCLVQE